MPISYDDAYAQTNPDAPEEQRDQAAKSIVAGTAASEAYWASRGTLEALQARADGHGVVVRNTGEEGSTAPAIEGTAVEEDNALASGNTVPPEPHLAPAPDNSVEAVAKLREQLRQNNITPEA